MKELAISVQTAGWLNQMGGEANADNAFKFIKDCGFEAVDYNIDNHLGWAMVNKGDKGDFYTKSIEELLEYYGLNAKGIVEKVKQAISMKVE